jgi:5'-deoxynucleotidase YfbR-like HD superfamily hydrolase
MILKKMLTLSHVPRWAIIDTHRPQNVAEHSYRVMSIALAISEALAQKGQHELDEGMMLRCAIQHDIDESETGDLPTPFKQRNGLSQPHPDTLEGQIIAIADLIEAYIFLKRYGVRSERIEIEINEKIWTQARVIQNRYLKADSLGWFSILNKVINIGISYE